MNTIEKNESDDLVQADVGALMTAFMEMVIDRTVGTDSEVQFTNGSESYFLDKIGVRTCDCCDKPILVMHGSKL